MQDDVRPRDESCEEAGEPVVADTPWDLPLPTRRSHRRALQLGAIAMVLLILLGVTRWPSRKGAPSRPAIPGEESEESPAEGGAVGSPPADFLADVAAYLTFEPETLESNNRFTVVKDVSGHGHHGILYGATCTERGQLGSGVSLDGSDACVELPTLKRADINSGPAVTISLWTNETRYHQENRLFYCGPRRGGGDGVTLTRNASRRAYSFRVPWLTRTKCSEEYGAGQWHHVVGVCSEQGIEVYVDGRRSELRACGAFAGFKKEAAARGFGAVLGLGYEGILDEVLVFRRRLFAEEIAALYRMNLEGRRPPPPAASPALGSFLAATDELLAQEGRSGLERYKERRSNGRIREPAASECPRDDEAYSMAPDGASLLVGNRWGWVSQEYFDRRPTVTHRVQPQGGRLRGLAPSPDGQRVACYGATGVIYLWDRAKAAPVAHFDTSLEAVASAGFTGDGASIVAAGRVAVNDQEKGAVALWNARTLQEVRRFSLPGLEVTAVAISPDGTRILAACLRDKQIHLLEAKTGRLVHTFPANVDEVTCLKFLPDSRRFLSEGSGNLLWSWDAQTGERIGALGPHFAGAGGMCLEVSGDGRHAACGYRNGTVHVWSFDRALQPGFVLARGRYQIGSPLRHVAFTRDGSAFVCGTVCGDFYRFQLAEISRDAAIYRPVPDP